MPVLDLLAIHGDDVVSEERSSQSLFGGVAGSQACFGPDKLAQRWLIEFSTERGSMPFLPDRGTNFMASVRLGRLHNENDVQAEFRFADMEARPNLLNEEGDDMPDDERFASAVLSQLILSSNDMVLDVLVTSLAGDVRSVQIPIPLTAIPADI